MADRKPKAPRVPPATPPPDKSNGVEKPGFERFLEAAEEAGVTDETLDKPLEKIAPAKRN